LPWIESVPPLNRPFGMADFDAASAGIDIDRVVFVEVDCAPARHVDEARWVASLARNDPRIAAIVAHAPLEKGAAAAEDLRALGEVPGVRGVRRLLQGEQNAAFCLGEDFLEGVRLLPSHDMHFEICIYHPQIEHAATMVENCPDVRFVLDHIGKPGIKDGLFDPWRAGIDRMAACPNVHCKLSGLVTEADHARWSLEDLEPYARHVIDAFGAARLIYGGDWPVVTLASEYRRWFDAASTLTAHLGDSDRRRIFHDNAAEFYGLG
jgi:L-fuconolactonase